MLSERKDPIETYNKRENNSKTENIHFLDKVSQTLTKLKQKLLNELIEETKAERNEVKNFNRDFEAKKADANLNMRIFMFQR